MAIVDIPTALEECRVCLRKWRTATEGLEALIEDAANYSSEAFDQSVSERMPELQRTTRASLARLSIFMQIKSEIENEEGAATQGE
ncbi:MAG: hypothetical protein WBQ89_22470 [Candidatus Acidiferrum sp.]